jgi:hypothetical protein
VGDRAPVVQSVVKHYTDWATPAPCYLVTIEKENSSFKFLICFYCLIVTSSGYLSKHLNNDNKGNNVPEDNSDNHGNQSNKGNNTVIEDNYHNHVMTSSPSIILPNHKFDHPSRWYYRLSIPNFKTRLGRCTLWSTLTFRRCSSHHITKFILVLMWSEVTYGSLVILVLMLSEVIVAQQWSRLCRLPTPVGKTRQVDT